MAHAHGESACGQLTYKGLQDKGYIQKDENGKWRVFITPSI